MKKARRFFIAMLLALLTQHAAALTKGETFVQNGFTYKVLDVSGKTVSVVGCTLSGSVAIPTTVTQDAVVWTVTTVGNGNDDSFENWSKGITAVTVPNTVKEFTFLAFYGCSLTELEIPASLTTITRNILPGAAEFKKYTVADGNTVFEADEYGVLYTKSGSLVQIPGGADIPLDADGNYVIPDRVTKLDYPFAIQHANMKSITISKNITEIKMDVLPSAFYGARLRNLTKVIVDTDNQYFSADDEGVLYDKAGTTLIYYPSGKNAAEYTVADNVTSIGQFAFNVVIKLKTLDINNVSSLATYSIYNLANLNTLKIGKDIDVDALTGAVVNCPNISDYVINEDNPYLVSIDGAIYSEDRSTLLLFPTNKTGDYIFPSDVTELTTISSRAFAGAKISSIEIPASVNSIGTYAFSGCHNLTSVTFAEPSTITRLESSAFLNCTALTEVTLPKSLKDLGTNAFAGCSALKTVHIPDGSQLDRIYPNAFYRCTELTTVDFQGSCTLRQIGEDAFSDKPNLKEFNMPATVKDIYPGAFRGCTSLATVNFAENSVITNIGSGAFADCGLENITLPTSVKEIQAEAFRNCTALTTVTLGESANKVAPEAFKGCTNLTNIDVVETNTTYSSVQGFLCNKAKTTLLLFPPGAAREDFTLLPPSLSYIGENAFYAVDGLTNICIPKDIVGIQSRAFGLDKNLNSVALLGNALIDPANIAQNTESNKNLNAFDDGSVEGTTNMYSNITLYLTQDAYTDWTSNHKGTDDAYDVFYSKFKEILTTFTVGDDEFLPISKSAANILKTNSTQETYVVPSVVTNEVNGITYLYNVNLIGDGAFQNADSKIKEVIINSKVGYIGSNAFDNSSIKNIVFTNATPADYLSTDYFGLGAQYREFATGQKIYVRADAIDAYKTAWGKYTSMIKCDIPLKDFAANGAMPFSREFDVELIASDGESTPVLAYVPKGNAGLGRNTEGELIDYIQMQQLRATVGGTEYNGTYIPAGTPVVLRAEKATPGATYRIGTKGSTAPITHYNLTGALYDDVTKTVATDIYGYYSLDGNGNGTRATGDITIKHTTALLDAREYINGVPAEKATLLFEAPSTEETTLVMNDEDTDESVTIGIDYTGPIAFGSGLVYADYNDIPTPGTSTTINFKRDHSSNNVTFIGNVTGLRCENQKVERITSLPSSLLSLQSNDCGLTELDVTNCPDLRILYCNNNKLTQLDLSQNPQLTQISTISPQTVSGYLIVDENEYICLKNDVVGQTYRITKAKNDYETKGGTQALNVETGSRTGYTNLATMIVNATAGRAHVQKVSSVGAATLYLNFDADIPEGVDAFYCDGIDGDLTYLYNMKGAVQANQGFMVRANEGWYVWNAATNTPADISSKNIFKGTTKAISCEPRSVLTLGRSVQKGRIGYNYYMGTTLNPYRSYIPVSEMDSYAKQYDFFDIVFDYEGEATSINGIENIIGEGQIYDLSGRKVNKENLKKGLYIVNGRKVVIK